MATLTAFSANSASIQDITGLEFAISLTTLYLYDNAISDLSPLMKLTSLNWLSLGYNAISDLSPLMKLTSLTWLFLSSNAISDLSPLMELTSLYRLSLNDNEISDLSPLEGLTSLTTLSLNDNDISDLSPLEGLTSLTTLRLRTNAISDLSPLAELTSLRWLGLRTNAISDLSPLAELTSLTTLDLYDNEITDYSPLLLLPNLSHVLADHGINDIYSLRFVAVYGHDHARCRFEMPLTYGRLHPSTPQYTITPIRHKGGVSGNHATVKAAPIVIDSATVNWTYETTVASESGRDPTTITVKFLNGEEREIDIVKAAAYTWESHGHLEFKFLEPSQSGASDIRVKFEYKYYQEFTVEEIEIDGEPATKSTPTGETFSKAEAQSYEPPSENHIVLPDSSFWSHLGTRAKYVNEETMHFTADFDRGTALHEFGHALGLTHEHLSPKFNNYFQWIDKEKVYKHYGDRNAWTRDDVNNNVLNTVSVADKLPGVDYDPDSIMAYSIPADLIKARPNAPQWAQDAATNGIKRNSKLSENDKAIAAVLYPWPKRLYISGDISVHAKDDDIWPDDDDYSDNRHDPDQFSFTHIHHGDLSNYIHKADKEYTWGDKECRVEVHLVVRNYNLVDETLEVGAYALLYEEDANSRGGSDLEDIDCETTRVRVGSSKELKLHDLDNRGLFELKFSHNPCRDVYSHDELYLGDATGGGDWADVTVKIEVTKVEDIRPVIAIGIGAPGSVSVPDTDAVDINGDRQVDAADLLLVSNYIGQTGSTDPRVDVNGDGIVTIADLVAVAQYLGQSTDTSASLQYSTVEAWIRQARLADDGSLVFQQGIAKLEYLLTLIIPEKTALLANYPNPFNPETWFPYHLSEPAAVALTIYTIDGKVVRHLDLGQQAAGFYHSKSQAAYWDGRNNGGEPVASGVYFYTLTAGDYTATRKMLIRK